MTKAIVDADSLGTDGLIDSPCGRTITADVEVIARDAILGYASPTGRYSLAKRTHNGDGLRVIRKLDGTFARAQDAIDAAAREFGAADTRISGTVAREREGWREPREADLMKRLGGSGPF